MNKTELAKLLYGYKVTQCLYVASKLNIADYINSGISEISELAEITKTDADALYRVMRCLASLGVFEEIEDKYFTLNAAAKHLLSNSEETMKDFICLCGEELYQSTGELLFSVKTGLPAFDHIYKVDFWEYLYQHPDKATLFQNAMQKGTEPVLDTIINKYDFSPFKNIIDIGGGKGHLICNILSKYPDCSGTVFDLANIGTIAEQYINQKKLAKRCQFFPGDFFREVPTNRDLYLLKVVLHDWEDKKARLILQNCRKAIAKNGKLLIIEKIVQVDKANELACLGDINMLVTLSGKERTLVEFEHLLLNSGFKLTNKIDTKTVFSIIEAEPI